MISVFVLELRPKLGSNNLANLGLGQQQQKKSQTEWLQTEAS